VAFGHRDAVRQGTLEVRSRRGRPLCDASKESAAPGGGVVENGQHRFRLCQLGFDQCAKFSQRMRGDALVGGCSRSASARE